MRCAAQQIARQALEEDKPDIFAVYLASIVQGGKVRAAADLLCRLIRAQHEPLPAWQVQAACIPI
jgi:hypothetical protein